MKTILMTVTLLLTSWTVQAQDIPAPAPNDEIKQALLQKYMQDPDIQQTYQGEENKLRADVTSLKETSVGHFQAVVETGIHLNDGSYNYSDLAEILKIYTAVKENDQIQVTDITNLPFPSQKLWAHYKVVAGKLAKAKNKNVLSRGTIKSVTVYYRVSDQDTADLFIPLENDSLKQAFRVLLVNPKAPSLYIFSADGKISVGQQSAEENDGDLAFGLRGGGRAWTCWNSTFLGVVTGVEKQKMDSLQDASTLLLPSVN